MPPTFVDSDHEEKNGIETRVGFYKNLINSLAFLSRRTWQAQMALADIT
jgi:hypothetical protein